MKKLCRWQGTLFWFPLFRPLTGDLISDYLFFLTLRIKFGDHVGGKVTAQFSGKIPFQCPYSDFGLFKKVNVNTYLRVTWYLTKSASLILLIPPCFFFLSLKNPDFPFYGFMLFTWIWCYFMVLMTFVLSYTQVYNELYTQVYNGVNILNFSPTKLSLTKVEWFEYKFRTLGVEISKNSINKSK